MLSRNATRSASRVRCVKHNLLVKDVQGPRRRDQEGVPHRDAPGVRDRWWSTFPKDVTAAQGRVRLSGERSPMRSYNPVRKGHAGPDQEGGAAPARGQAADDLHRRRRHPVRMPRPQLRELVRLLGFPVHQHADGARRLSRRPTGSSSACSACTARTKRTWRCSTAMCCSPSARASTTA